MQHCALPAHTRRGDTEQTRVIAGREMVPHGQRLLPWSASKGKNGPMLGRMEHWSTANYEQAWHCGRAKQEAQSLLPLIRAAGQTVAEVLDLIRVTPEEEKLLHAFAAKFPEFKIKVERSLDYRLRVEKEFCRLAGDVGALPCVPG